MTLLPMVADAHAAGYVITLLKRAATLGKPTVTRLVNTGFTLRLVDPWVIWLIIALVLAVAEVMTLTFVLGMIAGGAAAAAIVGATGAPLFAEVLTFGVVDVALLALVLPVARRHRHTPSAIRTGTAKLIGTRAMALSDINTADGGQVRIGGETWSARPYDDGLLIPAGEWVDVLAIDGATAVVHPTTLPGTGI
jgi:membrane protein implicated in regulation of membrane protease activity